MQESKTAQYQSRVTYTISIMIMIMTGISSISSSICTSISSSGISINGGVIVPFSVKNTGQSAAEKDIK